MSETVHKPGGGGLDAVADYLKNLRLRKVVMGGVDQEDAYEAMRELTSIFTEVYNSAVGDTEVLRRRLSDAESRAQKQYAEELSAAHEETQRLEQSLTELSEELEREREARGVAEAKAAELEAKFAAQPDGIDPAALAEEARRLTAERDEAKAKAESAVASMEAARVEAEQLRRELEEVQELRNKEQSERMLLDDIYIQAHRRKDEIINAASERAEAICAEATTQAEAIVDEAKQNADAIAAEIAERENKTRAEIEAYQKAQFERFEADERAFAEKQKAQEDELAELELHDREECDRMLTEAQNKRDQMLAEAQDKHDQMLAEAENKRDATLDEARKMASELIDGAREESERVHAEADRYMAEAEKAYRAAQARYNEMVERLSQQRTQIIAGIRKDVEALQEIAFDMSNHVQGRMPSMVEPLDSVQERAALSDGADEVKPFMQECIWEKENKAKLNTP